ncbi:MAG TPA: hypothetical protein VMG31_11200 [Verrucomicrobiae bacterium]|nr:hypothetical protein [Verrucomicrobiae bacterium]
MQGIDQILHSNGFSAADGARFKELLNAAVAHRRLHWEKMTLKDQEMWVLEYAELVHECGIDRVCAGMRKAWTWNKHLACAAEVRECLPPLPDVPNPRSTYHDDCAECCGTGWKPVMVYSKFLQRDERRMTRCHCNTRPYTTRQLATEADIAEFRAAYDALVQTFTTEKKTFYPRVVPPVVPLTREQIAERKPMERAECVREWEHLKAVEAQTNGCYEKQA